MPLHTKGEVAEKKPFKLAFIVILITGIQLLRFSAWNFYHFHWNLCKEMNFFRKLNFNIKASVYNISVRFYLILYHFISHFYHPLHYLLFFYATEKMSLTVFSCLLDSPLSINKSYFPFALLTTCIVFQTLRWHFSTHFKKNAILQSSLSEIYFEFCCKSLVDVVVYTRCGWLPSHHMRILCDICCQC